MSTCLLPKFWIGLLRTRSLFFFRVAFPRLVRLSIRSPICAFTGSSFGVSFNIESRFSGVARPTSTAIGAHHLHRAAGDGPVPDDVTHHTVLPTSSAISSPPVLSIARPLDGHVNARLYREIPSRPKQAMGIGTNMAWMGCRAIWRLRVVQRGFRRRLSREASFCSKIRQINRPADGRFQTLRVSNEGHHCHLRPTLTNLLSRLERRDVAP